ncbi:MAG: Uma2 family endonuclease [Hyphomicrobiaceae bacterium]|nr:MAG: Uma2 family endonuclease [Hyphomicrobiaceae bacterium]
MPFWPRRPRSRRATGKSHRAQFVVHFMVQATMRTRLKPDEQLTIEEFLAFTDTRPQEERWELIEGVAVLNPSPTNYHQIITGNILNALLNLKARREVNWIPLLGIGTRVPASVNSLPQPDVLVLELSPSGPATAVAEEAIVLFEVLSKSNTRADQAWRLKVYGSIRNCQHYVTVAQDRARIVRHDRASGWQPVTFENVDARLDMPAIGAAIPLSEVYRWTPLAGATEPS